MVRKEKNDSCCGLGGVKMAGCSCRVEAMVTVDERGQMVLPKEMREKAGIKAGDKLAVVSWGGSEKAFCISLMKADDLEEMVKSLLGPMMKDIFG